MSICCWNNFHSAVSHWHRRSVTSESLLSQSCVTLEFVLFRIIFSHLAGIPNLIFFSLFIVRLFECLCNVNATVERHQLPANILLPGEMTWFAWMHMLGVTSYIETHSHNVLVVQKRLHLTKECISNRRSLVSGLSLFDLSSVKLHN